MVKELEVTSKDLRHEQMTLERAANSRGRRSSAAPGEPHDLLIEREQEKMKSLNDKCKDFINKSSGGRDADREVDGRIPPEAASRVSASPNVPHTAERSKGVRIPTDSMGSPVGGDPNMDQSWDFSQNGRKTPRERERKISIAHPTDVHLELDPVNTDKNRNTSLRRSSVQNHRRIISTGQKWDTASQAKPPIRPKRDFDAKPGEDIQQLANEEDAKPSPASRRKSLPLVLGRRMTRHDRSASKSREQLLLPNLGQPRAHSPAQDMRVKITHPGEDATSIREFPSGRISARKSSFGMLSPRNVASPDTSSEGNSPVSSARSSRLEIDLSIPVSPSSPSPRSRQSSKREKTYTV